MNAVMRIEPNLNELHKSRAWFYKDLVKYLISPSLVLVSVFVIVGLFKDTLHYSFPIDEYLVWHNILEISCQVVCFSIFLMSVYAYQHTGNRRELFLGVSFLIVGVIDFMHTFSFPGMPAFISQNSTSKAIYYWLVARLVQAIALASSGFISTHSDKRRSLIVILVIGAVSLITLTFYVVTYLQDQLPAVFVPGQGLTPFKIWLEYIVIILALFTIGKYATTYRQMRLHEARLIMIGMVFFVFSELAFTLYTSAFDTYNLLGHVFKIGTTGSIFLAFFASSVKKPYIERKRADDALGDARDKLGRHEKLAAIGQISGGIAHELRNPLGVISNAAYYLKTLYSDGDERVKKYTEIIMEEVSNATSVIESLLDISQPSAVEKATTSILSVVSQIDELLTPPDEIQLSVTIPEDLPDILVDSKQLEIVIRNLLLNGYGAMPEGGELRIEAYLGEGEVTISISDTGCGIPEENIEKIFEPLFTTKPRGIGLGLTICKQLINANSGKIDVESKMGKGTVFTITLPTS